MPRQFLPQLLPTLAALALLAPAIAHAALPTALYTVNNHAGKVTITDTDHKALFAGQAATPAVQMIITCGPEGVPNLSADRTAYLTLNDDKGHLLWTQHVPAGPYVSFNISPGKARQGVSFTFTALAHPPNKRTVFFSQRGVFTVGKKDTLTAYTGDGIPHNITAESDGYIFDSFIIYSSARRPLKPEKPSAGFSTPIAATFIAPTNKNITPAAAHAAPPKIDTASYIINNTAGTVTSIETPDGKMLYLDLVATPTIQLVITNGPDTGDKMFPDKPLFLTLEDAKGVHLWQTQVSAMPRFSYQIGTDSRHPGTFLNFQVVARPNIGTRTLLPPLRLVAEIDGQNKLVKIYDSATVASVPPTDGKPTKDDPDDDATITGTLVNVSPFSVKVVPVSKNIFNLNAPKLFATLVDRDGKHYFSFPWHSHPVLIEEGCAFDINNAGELIINAPTPAKKP